MKKYLPPLGALSAICVFTGVAYLVATPTAVRANLVQATTGSGGGCTQATNFLARTSGLSGAVQTDYTTMICNLVTAGVWSKLDVFYMFATSDTTTAQLNLVSSSFPATLNGGPNFTANQGYLGVDASGTVFIDTGFNPTTAPSPNYVQNSGHLATWSLTNIQSSASGGTTIGQFDGTNLSQISPWYSDNHSYGIVNAAAAQNVALTTILNSTGDWIITRTNSSNLIFYRNGSSIGTNSASTSTAPINSNMYVLARNHGGVEAAAGLRIASASIGASLTAQNVTDYQSNVCAFITARNGSC